jgi:hypothetical protein
MHCTAIAKPKAATTAYQQSQALALGLRGVEQAHHQENRVGVHEAPEARRAIPDTGSGSPIPATASTIAWNFGRTPLFAAGETASLRPLPAVPLAAKLKIGPVDSPLEQEADRVADQVMKMTSVTVSGSSTPLLINRKCAACEKERQDSQEPSAPSPASTAMVDGKCAGCEAEETSELRMKQAVTATRKTGDPPDIVHQVLHSPGEPLDSETRLSMEASFGYDLRAVRMHTTPQAAQSASAIGARAYAAGLNIVFGNGEYAPKTGGGKHLLAHELTHVLQGRSSEPQTIRRQACAHDRNQGSGCGRLEATRGDDLVEIGADRVIAEAMGDHFPGTWIGQVYSPPNPEKGGRLYGLVDVMKVAADQNLLLDVAEVKSRNTGEGTGGCSLATREAQGYITVLQPLAPRMAAISKGLEKIGGLVLDDCRKFNKAVGSQLRAAGVDTANDQDMFAWCVLNSIQQKTGKPITKGFNSVSFRACADGTANNDYLAVTLPYPCKIRGKPGVGIYRMFYQVNTKGGISYRCEKNCQTEEEEKKRKEKEKDLSKDVKIDTGQRVETIQVDPIGDVDPKENIDIIEPPTGIDVTDVAIYTTATIAAATALNVAYKKAKTKAEQEAIRRAAERLALELERRGAAEVARTLDSKNLSKLGTEAYEKVLVEAEKKAAARLAEAGEERLAKKLATKLGEKAAKSGAKTLLEKGSKAIPYLGLAIAIYELGSAADAYAKGADIHFGLSGSDVDLSGTTKVDVKGEKGKGGVTTDVKAADTQIDMQVAAPPDASGIIELEAKNATIKGKMPTTEGSKLTVNLNLKLENANITYTSIGHLKGGHVVIDGALDIKDATIEIDIPPGTEVDVPSQEEGSKREIKGIKVKITKPGTGTGTVGAGKEGEAKGAPETKPPDPDAAERAKLLTEIQADERLKKIYVTYFTKKGTPALETLRRLAALKARLQAHPELLDKVLGQLKSTGAEIKDPIKEFIEPLERALDAAEKPAEQKGDPSTTPTPGDQPGSAPSATKSAPSGQGTQAAPSQQSNATPIAFWSVMKADYLKTSDQPHPNAPPAATPTSPTATAKIPVLLPLHTAKGDREYSFYLDATLDHTVPPGPQFVWEGAYSAHPPGQVLNSTTGDQPIYFADAATSKTVFWGLFKKQSPKPKKRP